MIIKKYSRHVRSMSDDRVIILKYSRHVRSMSDDRVIIKKYSRHVRSKSDDRMIIKKYSRHFLIAVVLFVGCNITSCDTDIVSRDISIINKMESRQVDGFCHF